MDCTDAAGLYRSCYSRFLDGERCLQAVEGDSIGRVNVLDFFLREGRTVGFGDVLSEQFSS